VNVLAVQRAPLARAVLATVVGGAAFWASVEFLGPVADDFVVEAVARPNPGRPAALPVSSTQPITADALPQERLDPDVRHNPFARLNLRPLRQAGLGAPDSAKAASQAKATAAPPPDPAPPPPPTAPPLPFTAIGSIEGADATSGQPVAFLQQQQTLFVVRKGESIGQLYRVESVSSEKVEFTYLPLNQRQSLSFVR